MIFPWIRLFLKKLLTKRKNLYIMKIEKGKTSNGYAKTMDYLRNNAKALVGWRYFFMEITKSNKIIIK